MTEAGYDAQSGYFLALPLGLTIPPIEDHPSSEDVVKARSMIEDALGEFPFENQASRANAFGFVLSMVLQPAIPGLLPMALITAPRAGSGKSFLVDLASVIATGRSAATSSPPSVRKDEEFRKRFTASLIAGERLIFLDNLDGLIKSPELDRALTSERWVDRRLGESENVELEQHVVWAMTGNNIELGGDLPRRCYLIQLDPKMARPSRREFQRPDLLGWARSNRGALLWACFTLARHWMSTGRNSPSGEAWVNFDGWRNFIGGILEACEIQGFLENTDVVLEEADPDEAKWANLLSHFFDEFCGKAVGSRELLVSLELFAQTNELPRTLSESLEGGQTPQAKLTRLGKCLSAINATRFDDSGIRIEKSGARQRATQWRILLDPTASARDLEVQP